MASSIFANLMREASLWWLVFVLCGAPVRPLFSAGLTFALSLLVGATMPMKWTDIRQLLLSTPDGTAVKGGRSSWKCREGYSPETVQTLVLLGVIICGAAFTQLDWAVWFQQWPLPVIVMYALARLVLTLVVSTRGDVRRKLQE